MARHFSFDMLQAQFQDAIHLAGLKSLPISQIHVDSRRIKFNDVFAACVGYKLDGRDFIESAIQNGASVIVCELNSLNETNLFKFDASNVTIVAVPNLQDRLSELSALLYGHPSEHLFMVGVTGTNGKSSTVQMIAQALHLVDGCCWTMGTLGVGPFGAQKSNDNTTADAATIQRELCRAVEFGCSNAAMEVSSHGLVQKRVQSVKFDVAVFTNLTRDHLDYHESMERYGEAKRRLFLVDGLQHAILNVDDRFGKKLARDTEITTKKWFVTLNQPSGGADLNQWIWADNIRLSLSGISADIFTPWGSGKLNVPLIGKFNIYNLLSVVVVLGIKLKSIEKILEIINQIQSVRGRMQLIRRNDLPLVIVDYAHTPDALEQAIRAMREHCNGKIITVFGCGGDRDPGKRPIMAKIAEKFSNRVILTDDNPRTELPKKIIENIQAGLKNISRVEYISDRKAAIAKAIQVASSQDAILIAGKGHEDYQIIGEQRVHFSDVEAIQSILEERAI